MLGFLLSILFLSIPVIVILFFVFSLVCYISANRKNKKQPGSVRPEEIKWRKTLLIVASVVMAVFLAVVIGLIALLATAVAFM